MRDVHGRFDPDFDLELFPEEAGGWQAPARVSPQTWATIALMVVLTWFLSPSASVTLACFSTALPDAVRAWRELKASPDKRAGQICSLFAMAWGFWKIGLTAISAFCAFAAFNAVAAMFAPELFELAGRQVRRLPPGVMASMIVAPCAFLASTILTGAACVTTIYSGHRIWIGEGMTEVRMLLLGMMVPLFAVLVVFPLVVLMAAAGEAMAFSHAVWAVLATVAIMAVVMLIALDRLSRRILAPYPGKYGERPPVSGSGSKSRRTNPSDLARKITQGAFPIMLAVI